jgi:hypothetical protein
MSSVAMEASWSSSAASSTAMAAGAGAGVGDDDMAALPRCGREKAYKDWTCGRS